MQVQQKVPFYAEDFRLKDIPSQLCSAGPYHCPKCKVKCGFGKRYLAEIDSDPRPGKQVIIPPEKIKLQPRTIALLQRVYGAVTELERGKPSAAVYSTFGFSSPKRMKEAIRVHKEEALARFGGGASAGVMGVGHTSPSLYHK